MKSYNTIFFDLDGTLTDSAEGITNSVAYALKKFGIEYPGRKSLYKYIGPPLGESLSVFEGLTKDQAELGVKYYREYFENGGMFENRVYDGVEDMLRTLKSAGLRLAVATSKPEKYSIKILEHFALADYFDVIAGADMAGDRVRKADVIARALELCCAQADGSVLMVGDREHDVLGAKAQSLPCLGVLYGFGDREELVAAGAIAMAETPSDVCRFILN